jgi:hypothetical protein
VGGDLDVAQPGENQPVLQHWKEGWRKAVCMELEQQANTLSPRVEQLVRLGIFM